MYLKCRFISGTQNMYNVAQGLTPGKVSYDLAFYFGGVNLASLE